MRGLPRIGSEADDRRMLSVVGAVCGMLAIAERPTHFLLQAQWARRNEQVDYAMDKDYSRSALKGVLR